MENVLWLILFDAEGYDIQNEDHLHEALSHRKVTTKLIKGLRKAIALGRVPLSDRVFAIVDEIDRDIDNRHMAAHGAWTMRPDGSLNCEYFRNFGTKRNPEWRGSSDPISVDQVDEALAAADRLLGEAIKTCSEIRSARQQP